MICLIVHDRGKGCKISCVRQEKINHQEEISSVTFAVMKEARKNPGLNKTCAINLFSKFDKNYSFANHKIFHLFSPLSS